MAAKPKKPAPAATAIHSVAEGILTEFADAVSADPGLLGVGARLKKTLVETHDLSEAGLRQALFGDAEP